jgi:hypothetical protein
MKGDDPGKVVSGVDYGLRTKDAMYPAASRRPSRRRNGQNLIDKHSMMMLPALTEGLYVWSPRLLVLLTNTTASYAAR